MKTSEVLRQARAEYAADPSHAPFGVAPRDGVCAVQAVDIAAGDRSGLSSQPHLQPLIRATGVEVDAESLGRIGIIVWNADATTDEVLAAFTRATAIAEAEEQEAEYGDPLPTLEPERVLA